MSDSRAFGASQYLLTHSYKIEIPKLSKSAIRKYTSGVFGKKRVIPLESSDDDEIVRPAKLLLDYEIHFSSPTPIKNKRHAEEYAVAKPSRRRKRRIRRLNKVEGIRESTREAAEEISAKRNAQDSDFLRVQSSTEMKIGSINLRSFASMRYFIESSPYYFLEEREKLKQMVEKEPSAVANNKKLFDGSERNMEETQLAEVVGSDVASGDSLENTDPLVENSNKLKKSTVATGVGISEEMEGESGPTERVGDNARPKEVIIGPSQTKYDSKSLSDLYQRYFGESNSSKVDKINDAISVCRNAFFKLLGKLKSIDSALCTDKMKQSQKQLAVEGYKPDRDVHESKLRPLAEEFMKLVDPENKYLCLVFILITITRRQMRPPDDNFDSTFNNIKLIFFNVLRKDRDLNEMLEFPEFRNDCHLVSATFDLDRDHRTCTPSKTNTIRVPTTTVKKFPRKMNETPNIESGKKLKRKFDPRSEAFIPTPNASPNERCRTEITRKTLKEGRAFSSKKSASKFKRVAENSLSRSIDSLSLASCDKSLPVTSLPSDDSTLKRSARPIGKSTNKSTSRVELTNSALKAIDEYANKSTPGEELTISASTPINESANNSTPGDELTRSTFTTVAHSTANSKPMVIDVSTAKNIARLRNNNNITLISLSKKEKDLKSSASSTKDSSKSAAPNPVKSPWNTNRGTVSIPHFPQPKDRNKITANKNAPDPPEFSEKHKKGKSTYGNRSKLSNETGSSHFLSSTDRNKTQNDVVVTASKGSDSRQVPPANRNDLEKQTQQWEIDMRSRNIYYGPNYDFRTPTSNAVSCDGHCKSSNASHTHKQTEYHAVCANRNKTRREGNANDCSNSGSAHHQNQIHQSAIISNVRSPTPTYFQSNSSLSGIHPTCGNNPSRYMSPPNNTSGSCSLPSNLTFSDQPRSALTLNDSPQNTLQHVPPCRNISTFCDISPLGGTIRNMSPYGNYPSVNSYNSMPPYGDHMQNFSPMCSYPNQLPSIRHVALGGNAQYTNAPPACLPHFNPSFNHRLREISPLPMLRAQHYSVTNTMISPWPRNDMSSFGELTRCGHPTLYSNCRRDISSLPGMTIASAAMEMIIPPDPNSSAPSFLDFPHSLVNNNNNNNNNGESAVAGVANEWPSDHPMCSEPAVGTAMMNNRFSFPVPTNTAGTLLENISPNLPSPAMGSAVRDAVPNDNSDAIETIASANVVSDANGNLDFDNSSGAPINVARILCANDDCVGNAKIMCGGCKNIYYCGDTCQKNHWTSHSRTCGTGQNEENDQRVFS